MYLDEDMWREILKTLPADVLCRFRCVSKSWNSLISSSSFLRSHLLFSSLSIDPKPYLLFDNNVSYALYNPDSQKDIAFHTIPFDINLTVIGDAIHGVVCLSGDRVTILWNPTIHKFVTIPRPESHLDVGFGFDGRNNDFKVVRDDCDCKTTTLKVYSYREGWSRAVDSDHIGTFSIETAHSSRCFTNGAIHWIIRGHSSKIALLVFDCETEELKTVELPQRFNRPVFPHTLFAHIGKVSVLEVTIINGKDESAVWVMDEYGVASSWKKTAYHKDIRMITEIGIYKLGDGTWGDIWRCTDDSVIKRSQHLWNGFVFEPSLLLMDDAESKPTGNVHVRLCD